MSGFTLNKMNTNQPKEAALEVTQQEYDEAMAKGWNDDDIQKPGKHLYRRTTRVAKPEDLHPSNTTIHIDLSIELDVLQHFEERAKRSNGASYQKLMNAALRAAMERDQLAEQAAIKSLLADERFISAVAEKVAALEAEKIAELEAA